MLDLISTDLIRILIIIPILIYASYTDILERRVDDKVWAIPTFLAIILLLIDAYFATNPISVGLSALFSLIVVGGAAYIIYKLRIFYGADYKAFLLIAVLFPWHPVIGSLPLYNIVPFYDINTIFTMQPDMINIILSYSALQLFGFTVFVNTTIFSIVYFIMNIIYNIRHNAFDIKKPLRSSCARNVKVSELDNIHAQVLDETKSNNKIYKGIEFIRNGLRGLSTDFFRDYETWYCENKTVSQNIDTSDIDDLDLDAFLNDNEAWKSTNPDEDKQKIQKILKQDMVWVTMGVPFIVPITFGVLSSIVFGNLMYILLS